MNHLKIFAFAIALSLSQVGCQLYVNGSTAQPVRATPNHVRTAPTMPAVQTTQQSQTPKLVSSAEKTWFNSKITNAFANGNFDLIDQEASNLRKTKERFPGGFWKLRALFRVLEDPNVEHPTEKDWQLQIKQAENWVKTKPQSITARIVLANTWENYAWEARGSGFANTVSDQAWTSFHNRLEKAQQTLLEADSLSEKCPEWYVSELNIAKGLQWDWPQVESTFEKGIAIEPTYYYLHQAVAIYLLPRWNGKPGQWERFAEMSADRIGGEQGDILLFAVYAHMMMWEGMDFWNSHQKVVPRLMRGFKSLEKIYGPDVHNLNAACQMSFFAHDPKTSDDLMARIGDNYDETVWRSKTNFDMFRQAAKQMVADASNKPNGVKR